jgi:hypothetical protein
LGIVGVSGELTSALDAELKHDLGGGVLVGCLRDSFGYITSLQQYQEGGYEVDDHQWHFSISHLEESSPSEILWEKLRKTYD